MVSSQEPQAFRQEPPLPSFRRRLCQGKLVAPFTCSLGIVMPAVARSDPSNTEINPSRALPRSNSLFNGRQKRNYCTLSVTDVALGTFLKRHQELRGGSQERLLREGDVRPSPCGPGPPEWKAPTRLGCNGRSLPADSACGVCQRRLIGCALSVTRERVSAF